MKQHIAQYQMEQHTEQQVIQIQQYHYMDYTEAPHIHFI
jgi:hypothetical protein